MVILGTLKEIFFIAASFAPSEHEAQTARQESNNSFLKVFCGMAEKDFLGKTPLVENLFESVEKISGIV